VIARLSVQRTARLIAFKPRGVNETRTHTAALLILDGGYRISEILDLPFENCDFDNLSMKVQGKATSIDWYRFPWKCGRRCTATEPSIPGRGGYSPP
jgi:hypothetical protein